jgi:uncharacterized protein YkwD
MAATGKTGKIGSDGSSHFDRLKLYGNSDFYRGENFSKGIKSGQPPFE